MENTTTNKGNKMKWTTEISPVFRKSYVSGGWHITEKPDLDGYYLSFQVRDAGVFYCRPVGMGTLSELKALATRRASELSCPTPLS